MNEEKSGWQKVTIGRTQSGQRGLFTWGVLAMSLDEEDTMEDIKALCERCRFVLQEES